MLDKNFDLERLVVSGSEKSIKDKVEYCMRLNEVGRGTLLRNGKATREQWVDMLVLCKDNLDCLYYFLMHNPALCTYVNLSNAPVIATHEIRSNRRHTIDFFSSSNDDEPAVVAPRKTELRRREAFLFFQYLRACRRALCASAVLNSAPFFRPDQP